MQPSARQFMFRYVRRSLCNAFLVTRPGNTHLLLEVEVRGIRPQLIYGAFLLQNGTDVRVTWPPVNGHFRLVGSEAWMNDVVHTGPVRG